MHFECALTPPSHKHTHTTHTQLFDTTPVGRMLLRFQQVSTDSHALSQAHTCTLLCTLVHAASLFNDYSLA